MTLVRDILAVKGDEVHHLRADDTVLDALKLMAEKNLGAVIIAEAHSVIGIFTERGYARNVFLKGRASPDTAIRDVMDTDVITVSPEDSVDTCMALMNQHRVRHLPVIREDRLAGVISIGDLMKSLIEARDFDIEQLVKYVSS